MMEPASCPGPESETAGRQESCQGCPNQSLCSSGQAFSTEKKQQEAAILSDIEQNLSRVQHKILVLSGKGGVGKSTVSTMVAWALSEDEDVGVGLLDIDICGPSLPKMLALEGEKIHSSNSGWSLVYAKDNLALMSIGFLLESPDEAVIWRGPKKNGIIQQFLKDVDWGDQDYLIIDTPPGTSDEHLSLVTFLKNASIDGAIIVTTPQELSLQDVRKEIAFCRKVGIRILGIIENMSEFICPHCSFSSTLFPPTTGGAQQLCKDMNIPFLGAIPLDPRIGMSCDYGQSFLDLYRETPAAKAYSEIIEQLKIRIEKETKGNK